MEKLTIRIDSNWSATDFSFFFREIEILGRISNGRSYKEAVGEVWDIDTSTSGQVKFGPPQGMSSHLDFQSIFEVERVKFASPGFVDLVGIGKCVEQCRLFLEFMIVHVSKRNQRQQEHEERNIRLANEKLTLLKKMRDSGFSDEQLKFIQSPETGFLIDAICEGQITSTE